jgi:hypothetical protein
MISLSSDSEPKYKSWSLNMSKIQLTNLQSAGSALFEGSESFLTELKSTEAHAIYGGKGGSNKGGSGKHGGSNKGGSGKHGGSNKGGSGKHGGSNKGGSGKHGGSNGGYHAPHCY